MRKISNIYGPKPGENKDIITLNNKHDNISKQIKAEVTKPPTPGSQAVATMQQWRDRLIEATKWDDFKIFVDVITGGTRTITLDVDPTDTIRDVKLKIQLKGKIELDQQKLWCGQVALDDDLGTLTDYRIKKNSKLQQQEPEKPPPPDKYGHIEPSPLARKVARELVEDPSALAKFKTAFNTRMGKAADDEDWLATKAAKDKLQKIYAQYCTKEHYDENTKQMKVLDEMDMKYIFADRFKEKVMTLWRDQDVKELVDMLEKPFTIGIGQIRDASGNIVQEIPDDLYNTCDLEIFEKIGVLKPEKAAEEVATTLLTRCKELKVVVPSGGALAQFKEQKANEWREYEREDVLTDKNMIRDEMKKMQNVINHDYTTKSLLEGAVKFINAK